MANPGGHNHDKEVKKLFKNEVKKHLTPALSGDLEFKVTPETVDTLYSDQNESGYTRTVEVELVDGNGNRQWWFTEEVPIAVEESTSGDGAISVETTTPTMEDGYMKIEVEFSGTWANTDTNTLTVSEKTILGYTVSEATSVETSVDE